MRPSVISSVSTSVAGKTSRRRSQPVLASARPSPGQAIFGSTASVGWPITKALPKSINGTAKPSSVITRRTGHFGGLQRAVIHPLLASCGGVALEPYVCNAALRLGVEAGCGGVRGQRVIGRLSLTGVLCERAQVICRQ